MVFTEINCNGEELASLTGMDLVTGSESIGDEEENSDANIWAILALASAAIGIIVYFAAKSPLNFNLILAAAVIGLASMVALYFDIKQQADNEMKSESDDGDGFNLDTDLSIDVEMKFGYWFVLICFIATILVQFMTKSSRRNRVE